ncbi:sulfatase-like hydrolase/transferase [uncultured Porticoccus sp.]|uniref:sulfatase family protein n=1 Tax=uncultured Porticoccus sp. TaxID=1256050 RepID=UPI00262B5549|nr:sulfatase-like hydrolase/transferase [uncultured Porticoccus sp.]
MTDTPDTDRSLAARPRLEAIPPRKSISLYTGLILGFLLVVLVANFYQVLIVAPDQVDMKAFYHALLVSPGFWWDLGYFVLAMVAIHLAWLFLLWLASAGWLGLPAISPKNRQLLPVLLFLLSALLLLVWSNRRYPQMQGSGFLHQSPWLMSDAVFVGLLTIFAVAFVVSLGFLIRRNARVWGSACVLAVGAFGVMYGLSITAGNAQFNGAVVNSAVVNSAGANGAGPPNIFIIGIDSLRPDQTGYFGNTTGLTPNVDKFLQQSTVFENAYTPYARTFPAWMSILTGAEPVNHNGRYNLTNHKYIDKNRALGRWMQNSGYRSIYAMDERRFNNIDETFGFDEVVGPEYGALNFMLGGFDHPLVNLLCNTVAGKWLFPNMYLNRGRDMNYDPERYSQAILDAVVSEPDKPVFLAAHFVLPHWPWLSREWEPLEGEAYSDDPAEQSFYRYRMMLKQVDRQFGQFMADLEATGALDNAYVFFMSDHGDGFDLPADELTAARDDAIFEVYTTTRGHATNLLNLGQSRVLLAAKSYGNDDFGPALRTGNGSLMDIAPTISELLDNRFADKAFDGLSLLSVTDRELSNRPLFMETGVIVTELTKDEINKKRLLTQTVGIYATDAAGKLVVRDDFRDMIIRSKHRAVVKGDWQLTLIPSMGEYLVLINIPEKKWWSLDQYEGDADTAGMLRDLCEHYKNDVGFDTAGICDQKIR